MSPGSRNTPIILALARSELFHLHYIVDERVAAFAALGMAIALDQTVATVCTSGTAVLNYAPALAEAYYSHVPIVAISADRPYYDIEQNRPQTICQADVLKNIVRKSVNIRDDEDAMYSNRLINEALIAATDNIKGPVHINMQFAMPLTISGNIDSIYSQPIRTIAPINEDKVELPNFPEDSLLFVGGIKPGHELNKIRKYISCIPSNITVIAEAQSNLSDLSAITSAEFEANIDKISYPEHIFIAGSPLVSTRIGSWIDKARCQRTYVGCTDIVFDHDCLRMPLSTFLKHLSEKHANTPDNRQPYAPMLFRGVEPSIVSRLIGKFSGKDILLHISNGMSIREAQKVAISPPTEIWSNRGVSGIDGCTSSAIGSSLVTDRPVVFISGDMSAAYDIGALATEGVRGNFTMIVVNNNGGEIFRRVATTRDLPERDIYFTAMPKFPLKQIAQAYGFEYISTDNPDTIEIRQRNKPRIIELKITNK